MHFLSLLPFSISFFATCLFATCHLPALRYVLFTPSHYPNLSAPHSSTSFSPLTSHFVKQSSTWPRSQEFLQEMERFDSQPPKQPSWDQMDLHKFYFPKFNPDRLLYGEYVFMHFHHITHQASDILRAIMGIASSQAGNEPSKTICHPREDQIGLQLSADTAQAILPTKRMCFGSKVRSLPSYFKI